MTPSTGTNITLGDEKDIVAKFHEAMAIANAGIRENPRTNIYTVYNKSDIQDAVKPAPYLEYDTTNSTTAQKLRRSLWRRQLSNETSPRNSSTQSYTIPPEVVEAARILAEAYPPDASANEYDAIVVRMKEKYAPKNNDTNAMPQVLQQPSGLLEYVANVSEADPAIASSGARLEKRAASDFWMENIVQLGSSPLAPPGTR